MVYPYEFVAGGRYVKIRLFFVDEERVRHPDVFYELRSHGQRFHPRPFLERQPRIGPELSEVKVQREVLQRCVIVCAGIDENKNKNPPKQRKISARNMCTTYMAVNERRVFRTTLQRGHYLFCNRYTT